jgi:hypothetical protein
MTTVLNLILLPLRAPMMLLLLVISVYLGLHWSRPGSWADAGMGGVTELIWSAECLHALLVVVVCTVPDLLLRRVSSMMAASRVISLVLTLLLVTIGGLYLLHLDVLSNVLILASSVLLARLDLVRLRVVPPPFVMTLILSVLVLGGISLGRSVELQIRPYVGAPQETRAPASDRRAEPAVAPHAAGSPLGQPLEAAGSPASPGSRPTTPAAAAASPHQVRGEGGLAPDRAIPHLDENLVQKEAP